MERIEVTARFGPQGEITPLILHQRSKTIPVTGVGRRWSDPQGVHILVMVPGEQIYELLVRQCPKPMVYKPPRSRVEAGMICLLLTQERDRVFPLQARNQAENTYLRSEIPLAVRMEKLGLSTKTGALFFGHTFLQLAKQWLWFPSACPGCKSLGAQRPLAPPGHSAVRYVLPAHRFAFP